jgi:hypothetical protein
MTALVQTAGVHGYSSPCPNHVVFSSHICMSLAEAFNFLLGEHLIVGAGCYKGVQERAYALPEAVFHEMQRRWPHVTADQESILILGSPRARNWRPATLRYIDGSGRADVDLGIWRSVTYDTARKQENWSFFNGSYFICEVDPPANMFEAEQREIAKKLAALDSILKTLNVHFDTDLLDYQGVADGLDTMLKSQYDNAFNAGIDTGAT